MTNTSIKAAFKRMWQYTVNALDDKAEATHLQTIESGGTGATTAAGAIAGLSDNKLTLNNDNTLNGVFNSLVINGIDFTLTSAEYDELLSLAGGI